MTMGDSNPIPPPDTPVPLEYRAVGSSQEDWERVRRRLAPPGPLAEAIAITAALFSLWCARAPGGDQFWILPVLAISVVLALYWVGRAVDAFIHVANGAAARVGISPGYRRWLLLPGIALTTLSLIALKIPLHLGFRISRPSMEQAAQRILGGTALIPARQRVGVYVASRPEIIGGGVRFITNDRGIFSYGGFAYFPASPPTTSESGVRYVHLQGPWYQYFWDD
jgi:hypothetical protein